MKPIPFLIFLAAALALAACSGQPSVPAADRTIYMAAIEPKGSANVADESFPSAALPAGAGYALIQPDADGKWTIETYRWEPSQIVVFQGDTVTLEIVGVNGKEHPFTIEGYNIADVVRRGHVTRVTFVADKPGVFRITCTTHVPSMTANLVVLPNQ